MSLFFLEKNWTSKGIVKLESKLKKLLLRISKHLNLYPASLKNK